MVTTLQTEKNVPTFLDVIAGNMSRTNAHLLIQILREHHVRKMNYSTNKVQLSFYVELQQSNCPDYTNPLTVRRLWAFLDFGPSPIFPLTFPGFQKFQKSVQLGDIRVD